MTSREVMLHLDALRMQALIRAAHLRPSLDASQDEAVVVLGIARRAVEQSVADAARIRELEAAVCEARNETDYLARMGRAYQATAQERADKIRELEAQVTRLAGEMRAALPVLEEARDRLAGPPQSTEVWQALEAHILVCQPCALNHKCDEARGLWQSYVDAEDPREAA